MFVYLVKWFRKGFHFFIDLIFPRECVSCGQEGTWLCTKCTQSISYNERLECVGCRKPHLLGKTCDECHPAYYLDYTIIAFPYENEYIQKLIKLLKYSYVEELGEVIGGLLSHYVQSLKIFSLLNISNDELVLSSVPLHKKRILERGFNQSDLIGEKLARDLDVKFFPTLLKREVQTESQAQLNKYQRGSNVKGAFALKGAEDLISDKNILLLDDVLTTGSTLNECAKMLKKAGARKVIGIVIARN